jgi:hypothetical protein
MIIAEVSIRLAADFRVKPAKPSYFRKETRVLYSAKHQRQDATR